MPDRPYRSLKLTVLVVLTSVTLSPPTGFVTPHKIERLPPSLWLSTGDTSGGLGSGHDKELCVLPTLPGTIEWEERPTTNVTWGTNEDLGSCIEDVRRGTTHPGTVTDGPPVYRTPRPGSRYGDL